jgi:parallel beta-helix repeat protein
MIECQNNKIKTSASFIAKDYIVHPAISITSNEEFLGYGFLGNGTESNPYVIENYNITTDDSNGISIEETTVHFIIRNCYINCLDTHHYCIIINSIENGTSKISNNVLFNTKRYGINVFSSYGMTIEDNYIHHHDDYGIYIYGGKKTVIKNNQIDYNCRAGLRLRQGDNSIISSNSFENNYIEGNAITVESSDSVEISENYCRNNTGGITVHYTTNSTIFNN